MRVVSDFREAMWGVLQQGISTLDVDFVAYAAEHFDRLLANAEHARPSSTPCARPPATDAGQWQGAEPASRTSVPVGTNAQS